ncbi:IS5 family transposase, partial [Streptomyces canarius]|uniref:IS5 family transposase n=1 Tax=Streptomyces canarius TaxID=285453 RepID=UPI002795D73B
MVLSLLSPSTGVGSPALCPATVNTSSQPQGTVARLGSSSAALDPRADCRRSRHLLRHRPRYGTTVTPLLADRARPAARPVKRDGTTSCRMAAVTRPFRSDQPVVGPGVPLADAQWARIEPLLPDRTPKRGGRRRDHREVIDAIAFKFQTGTQWVHLPERYGNWRGVYNRLRMWAVDGTWERVFTALVAQADADEDVSWAVSVDSTIVHAHQHAAGARTKGPRPASGTTTPSAGPAADRRRRSTSRPTADGRCRPLVFVLTAGQAED